MNTIKFIKNNKFAIINILLINCMFILPMTGLDYTSYVSHDARWWLNQYYEFYHTIGHSNIVAFNGFNHTGLLINSTYPNITLKLFELPLVLFHIINPYLVIGFLTILITNIYLYMFNALLSELNTLKSYRLSLSCLYVAIISLTGKGIVNSIPQLISVIFIIMGAIAISSKNKDCLMAPAVAGLLMTSLTTSVIGLITFIIIFFIKPSMQKFIRLFSAALIGLLLVLPKLIMILYYISQVNLPYQGTMSFFPKSLFVNNSHGFLYITIATFILLVPLIIKPNNPRPSLVGWILLAYIIISAFPQFASELMSFIQKGTFQRMWVVVSIISVYWITPTPTKSHKLLIDIVTLLLILTSVRTYVYYPISNAKPTPLIKALKHKDWDTAYSVINSNVKLIDKSGQYLIYSTISNTAKFSPDYTPKEAKTRELNTAFTPSNALKKKYGVSKFANKPNTLTIYVSPKSNQTPLGVWSYSFIKYHVSSSNGKVTTKNGMFYYYGTSSTKITIRT